MPIQCPFRYSTFQAELNESLMIALLSVAGLLLHTLISRHGQP